MAYGEPHVCGVWCAATHGKWFNTATWSWPSTTYTFNPEFSDNGYVGLHRR